MTFQIKRLVKTASIPRRASQDAAGYDLHACLVDEDGAPRKDNVKNGTITLMPGERALIPTGLSMTTPEGTYGRIGPRSGFAYKNGIDVMAGILDRDYSGEVGIVLINLGQNPFVIEHDMRVAQLVLERILTPDVEEVDELGEHARGVGGFGSTGQ
jgi:dUTP pyrophosphatase